MILVKFLVSWLWTTQADGIKWLFFLQEMIPAEIQYKTLDDKFLAIVEAFKTWRHYLEGCKHKVLIFTDYNNLHYFINTKSLNYRQVYLAQKLS